jgi:preprotein translocase subunit SecY
MRYLVRVTSAIVTLTLLLAVVVAAAQVRQARTRQGQAASVSTAEADRAEDTSLICLALVVGTALLAGGVWMRKLRGMLS